MTKNPFRIQKGQTTAPLLANIPHSSTKIPSSIRKSFVLNDARLHDEVIKVTDWYVDELFSSVCDVGGVAVVYEVSRLVLDPERFEDDGKEVMAAKGLGVIYTKTCDGRDLRASAPANIEREELLNRYYRPYHRALENETQALLDSFGACLVLDCHSFPAAPLPYELNQDPDRPDICLGTDPFHTPGRLVEAMAAFFDKFNLTTARNKPFEGTLLPSKFMGTEKNVSAIMIEVNRRLYMDEATGAKSKSFTATKEIIGELMKYIKSFFVV